MARRQKRKADIKIGRRLKKLRLAVGLAPEDVAEAIDYKNGNTVICWEEGWRPIKIKTLRILAVFFGASLHWLQTGEGGKYDGEGGKNSFAEQTADEQAIRLMLKITERYTKAIEAKITVLPRLVGLLKEIEKITKVEGIHDIEESRYDEFLGRMLALAMTVHRIARKSLTGPSDYENHRLVGLNNLQKIESQSKEILAYLQAKGVKKIGQINGLQTSRKRQF